jgi:raffinose/stachyose/melibiose transport system permease protein
VTTSRRERLLTYTVLLAFAALALYPIVAIVLVAVQSPGHFKGGFGIPHSLDLGNVGRVWSSGFGGYLRSSAYVTVPVVIGTTFVSILAGYAFGTMDFPGSRLLFYALLAGLVVPTEAIVVPLYFDLRSVSLTDTYVGLILPEIASSVAFGTFWMRAFFRSAPRGLIDAARIDGAGSWQVLWRVLLPLGRPAVMTLMALVFMWTWNDFLLPLVLLSGGSITTAQVGLAFFVGQRSTDIPGLAAAAIITAVPAVVVYVFFQRHFIRGMLSGALVE